MTLLERAATFELNGPGASMVQVTCAEGPHGLARLDMAIASANQSPAPDDTAAVDFSLQIRYGSGLREHRQYRIAAPCRVRPATAEDGSLQTRAPTTRIMRAVID